jgi:carboxypeptidase T
MKYHFVCLSSFFLIYTGINFIICTSVIGQGIPGYPCYRMVEETFASAQLLGTNYPDLATWIDIGDSWEKTEPGGDPGYNIYALRLTNSAVAPANPKPKLIIVNGIHPQDYVPPELALRFAEYLVQNYGQDADISWIFDYHEIHLILHANPDGRKKAEQGLYWAKNTNENYCSPTSNYRGANLDRNFEFQWGCCGGSSGDECNDTYRGPSQASEPETQAIQNYIQSIFTDNRPNDLTSAAPDTTPGILLHLQSNSELVMWPWGFTFSPTPNGTALQTLGRKLAFFNGYTPQQAAVIYPTDGTLSDFSYGDLGVATISIFLGTDYFQDCATFENTILPDNLNLLIEASKMLRTPYLTPSGPDVININVGVQLVDSIQISATINDTAYSNVNGIEPSQNIISAEYYIDVPPWVSQPPPVAFLLTASDGRFDSPVEDVTALIDVSVYSPGRHIVFIRGQDADGNWGSFSAAFIDVSPINDLYEFTTQSNDQHTKVFIHPLPVRLNTNIELHVDSPTLISVEIYDLLGKKVRSITNRVFSAGTHNLLWDSRDEYGSLVTSGVYFLRLLANGKVYNHKMMRIK